MRKYINSYRYKRKIFHILDKMYGFEYSPTKDPNKFLSDFHRSYFSHLTYREIENLFLQGGKDFDFAVENSVQNFPDTWKSGKTLGSLISVLVRLTKPQTVVETGVANGVSTSIIARNLLQTSTLHSFDTDQLTSESITGFKNWHWHKVDEYRPEESLQNVISRIGPNIDLWIHDSDHSGYWQNFEYRLAMKNLRVGGFLISDDIHDSSAWLRNFGKINNLQFLDGKKQIGILRKSVINSE